MKFMAIIELLNRLFEVGKAIVDALKKWKKDRQETALRKAKEKAEDKKDTTDLQKEIGKLLD